MLSRNAREDDNHIKLYSHACGLNGFEFVKLDRRKVQNASKT